MIVTATAAGFFLVVGGIVVAVATASGTANAPNAFLFCFHDIDNCATDDDSYDCKYDPIHR